MGSWRIVAVRPALVLPSLSVADVRARVSPTPTEIVGK